MLLRKGTFIEYERPLSFCHGLIRNQKKKMGGLFQAAVFEDLAILQMNQAIGLMREFFVVGDDDKRGPMRLI